MYLNKAIIIGNLTRDPEQKALPSGVAVTSFSVAKNRVYKDKNGNKQEQTEYHNVVVFGRQAETSGQYLKKGQNVLVEGRMQTRSWEQDGVKKYRTEIIADAVQFGQKAGGASSQNSNNSSNPNQDGEINQDAGPSSSSASQIEYPEDEINPDDIPF
jgi:single-strand DNA-binding protein